MSVKVSCSWCHEQNPVERMMCARCGHEAQVPRGECRCFACRSRPAPDTRSVVPPLNQPERKP